MSKSRKILGALLAVVLVLNVFAVSAFASIDTGILEAEGHSYSASMTLVGSTDTSATVKVVANYALGGIQFRLSGITLSLDVSDVEVSGYYGHYDVRLNADGLVFILPDSTSTAGIPLLQPETEVTITVKGTKTGTIAITGDVKSSTTPKGEIMALRLDGGTVQTATIYWGQPVTISNDGTTPTPPAGEVTLTGASGTTGIVDNTRAFVYGVPDRTSDPTTYFSTTGYMEMEANDKDVINGTGAKLNLYSDNSKATLVKSYTLVIIGDVNGDGTVTADDSTEMQLCAVGRATFSDAVTLAGDINYDGVITADDSTEAQLYSVGRSTIDLTKWK